MTHCLPTGKKIPFAKVWHVSLFICAVFFCSSLHAQQTITGRVTSNDTALAGVTVQVKGTKTGTSTDRNGSFTITASPTATLVFSSVGYASQEVTVNNQTTINVNLQATVGEMNEVVVIGYQTVRRKDLTGATGVVNMANASRVLGASVGEQIQGLVPGVTVRNGGAPGQNPIIEIRGVGSFGNTTPLYVIDGMIADANSTINTDEIASIQILKDASAAAIYGSRAGNGVIIITTKKGREGPSRIFGSAKYGVQQIPKKWDVMDATQYLQTVKQQYANSGQTLPSGIADQIANNTIKTDWQDETYRNGAYEDYNLGISGGSHTGNYLVSGSYYKNDGTLVGNSFERASIRINTEARKGMLSIGENMVLSSTDGKNPGGGVNAFNSAALMPPIIAVQDSSIYSDPTQYPQNPGGWGIGSSDNPTYVSNYLASVALDKQKYSYAKIVGNVYAQLDFTKWLSYRFNLGIEASYDYAREIRDTGTWRYADIIPNTSIAENRSRFTNFLMEHTLNINKSFGLHNISAVFGFSRTQQMRDYTDASRTILLNVNGNIFTTIGSAQGTPSVDGGLVNKWRNHGWLGRINYSYADKYLLTLTGRIDQDSRFSQSNRTGYFPSVAGAWRISKESFFNVSWISDLKLRASYGKLGFSDVLTAWQYVGFINSNPRGVYGTGQVPVIGRYQTDITNPNLKWETRVQKNIGLDAGLFNNQVTLSVDVYNSTSKDVLVNVPLANYLGSTGSPYVNTGSIKNTGVEFSATYRNNSRNFKWELSGNFTTIKNEVLSVGNQGVDLSGNPVNYLEPANYTRSQVGHNIGAWYVIQTAGLFQTQEEVDSYVNKDGTKIQPNAKPGDVKYVDQNGDGQINNEDRVYRGSPWPTLQTGLQFNGTYGQFSINLQFVGIFGNKIYDDIRRALDSYELNNFRSDIHPWTTSNTNTTDPRLAVDYPDDPSVAQNNMNNTDRWLENGSYIRLRNLEIGYTFSNNMLKRISFNSARIYVSGQNLFTITKYKGLDPDISNGDILQRGFDAGFWPSSRIYSAGIQFEF